MKVGQESIFYNAAPPEQRAAKTRAALEAGKHVYSEAPLAASDDEIRALASLAKSRSLVLCAGNAGA